MWGSDLTGALIREVSESLGVDFVEVRSKTFGAQAGPKQRFAREHVRKNERATFKLTNDVLGISVREDTITFAAALHRRSTRIEALLGNGLPTTATIRLRRSTSSENDPFGPAAFVLLNTPIIEHSASAPCEEPHSATQS